jgi:hypothetical protein
MGSKVSLQPKRLKKAEFTQLCNTIDRQQFLEYYLNNGNEAVCSKFNFGLNTMYRLVKYFEITLTEEQLKYRNKIASSQRTQALYGVDNNFQRKEVQAQIKSNNLSRATFIINPISKNGVLQLDDNKTIINEYKSVTEAAQTLNTKIANISCAIKRNTRSCGFYWQFKNT